MSYLRYCLTELVAKYSDLANRGTVYTAAAVLLFAAFIFAAPAAAQRPVTDDDVNEIARDLYCPICENTPLDACPTQACQDWREEIRVQLSEGRTRAEIEQYFVERHGARVLAQPRFEGFTALVWLLPILAVLLGGFLFWRYLTALRQPPPGKREPDPGEDTAMMAQSSAQKPPPVVAPGDDDEDDYISRVEKEVRDE